MQREQIVRALEASNANLQQSLTEARRQLRVSREGHRSLEEKVSDLQTQLGAKVAKEKGKMQIC